MLYCDSRCSQTLTGLSLALPGAVLCNATRRMGDRQRVLLRQMVRGSVRAVRAVRNTRVFQTETRVVADASSASPSFPLSELAGLLRLCPIATSISSNVFSGCMDVNLGMSAYIKSSCSCRTAASASSTHFLAPAVSLSTHSTIHFSFSSLLEKCVCRHFSATSFCLDLTLHNAPTARPISASKPLLRSFGL
jgi:hypothetical protein